MAGTMETAPTLLALIASEAPCLPKVTRGPPLRNIRRD
jgi:hypothetical protein